MVLLHTPQIESNFYAPAFSLKATDGRYYTFEDIKGAKGTVVLFICNHCPYVKAIIEKMVQDMQMLQKEGIGVVAIMPNDTRTYPEDSFENMKIFARQHGFTFPYLIDETQDVTKSYRAVCTPDIFGFNAGNELQYRGRFDSGGKNEEAPDAKRELREAMLEIARTGTCRTAQVPSMGCSIKWKE